MNAELLPEEFKKNLAAHVATYEKQTSIEFVPIFIKRASEYFFFRTQIFWIALSLCLVAFRLWHGVHWPIAAEFLTSLAVAGGLFALVSWPPLLARVLPGRQLRTAVEKRAAEIFLREEIFATRARSGLLLVVSYFEKSVYLLADRGLTAKVPVEEWQKLGAKLARDFDRARPGDSFLDALDAVMKDLGQSFPPDPDNPNELSDHLRY